MFRIEAPYPELASTILMPSPDLANNQGLTAQVNVVRMMDGSTRTSVRPAKGKKVHRYDFFLSREKMEEVVDFVKRYSGDKFRVTWRDAVVIGKVSANPVEPAGEGRAGGWPGGEAYSLTLELRET